MGSLESPPRERAREPKRKWRPGGWGQAGTCGPSPAQQACTLGDRTGDAGESEWPAVLGLAHTPSSWRPGRAGGVVPRDALGVGTGGSPALGPGATRPAGAGTACEDGEAGAQLPPAKALRALRLLLPAPRFPRRGTPGGALIPRKGTAPSRSQPSPATRAGRAGGCLPHAPPRTATVPPRVTGSAGKGLTLRRGGRAERCRPGGISRRRPPPFRRRREWPPGPPPRPRPGPDAAARLQRRTAANGLRGGGTAGGGHPPGDGSAETGSARAAAAPGPRGRSRGSGRRSRGAAARGPLLPRLRRTDLAPRLAPRAPDRHHDRRAAPGLLLHRAEG